jgi:NADP-dependent 3-hydroxy acid dehydrogenase YdfG
MQTYAVVTGATSGIGRAISECLAKEGHNLVLLARRGQVLEEMKSNFMREHEIDVKVFQVDLTDMNQIEVFFDKVKDLELDVLVNNAGLALGKSSFDEYDWEDFETMIDTNVKGFLKVAHLLAPNLRRNSAHIINISSIAGIEAYEGGSVYCATKAFVKMISKALRIDMAGSGVRVTDIAPGLVDTGFSEVRFKGDKEKADKTYEGFCPLYAEDIASCAMFAIKQPASVNVEYMLVMPTCQASATRVVKE